MGTRERARRALLLGAALSLTGCMVGPVNGQLFDGDGGTTTQQVVNFQGFFTQPNALIRVQVLRSGDLDAGVDGNWVDVGKPVSTGTQAYYYNDPSTPMYLWSLDAKPGAAAAGAWPAGGLARVRAQAITKNGSQTTVVNEATVFDDDFVTCRNEHSSESWEDIMSACQSPYGTGTVAALVSTNKRPSDNDAQDPTSPYLSLPLGAGSDPLVGLTYYVANFQTAGIGTLDAFKSTYGFTGDLVAPMKAAAVYYNAGDLGLGREMHCRLNINLTKVCYVTNYADHVSAGSAKRIFGGAQVHVDSALAHAIKGFKNQSGSDPVATVAMVQSLGAPILFLVYGADGTLSPNATLDASANPNTEVPKNCITCHAGAGSFDGATVSGAHFLLFDLDSFQYSSATGFGKGDQLAQFRTLNDIAAWNDTSAGISKLYAGWYPDSTSAFHGEFVPSAWKSAGNGATKVYDNVIKKDCRTCHSAMNGVGARPDFLTPAQLTNVASVVQSLVCESHTMPQALVTQDNFWNSSARAHLVGFLGLQTACKP